MEVDESERNDPAEGGGRLAASDQAHGALLLWGQEVTSLMEIAAGVRVSETADIWDGRSRNEWQDNIKEGPNEIGLKSETGLI
jgi:hypothetical protein